MKSATPKVLHRIAGLPMLAHVAKAASRAGADTIAIVVGHNAGAVRKAASASAPGAEVFVQEPRLGTGHAVLAAREAIARGFDDVLVMFADTPLIDAGALTAAREKLAEGCAVSVVGFRTDRPAGYGRLIEQEGALVAIREDKDCSPAERLIDFCNSGLMAISGAHALALLDKVENDNAKGEFYLTDIVAIARAAGLKVSATETPFESTLGVNTLRRTRRGGSRLATPPPPRGDACRRDAGRPGNGLFLPRYGDRRRRLSSNRTFFSVPA